MLEELKSLTNLVKEINSGIPILALMDGSLIMLDLIGQTHPEFVKRELVQNGFVEWLDELYEISKQKKLLSLLRVQQNRLQSIHFLHVYRKVKK